MIYCIDCATTTDRQPAKYVRILHGNGTARAVCASCAAEAATNPANRIHPLSGMPSVKEEDS